MVEANYAGKLGDSMIFNTRYGNYRRGVKNLERFAEEQRRGVVGSRC